MNPINGTKMYVGIDVSQAQLAVAVRVGSQRAHALGTMRIVRRVLGNWRRRWRPCVCRQGPPSCTSVVEATGATKRRWWLMPIRPAGW
ncbi:MAG: hypothetical protein R3A44_34565 [Caldilineaceae bacterium]